MSIRSAKWEPQRLVPAQGSWKAGAARNARRLVFVALRVSGAAPCVALLRRYWPWPVAEYESVVGRMGTTSPVLGLGDPGIEEVRDLGVADHLRTPTKGNLEDFLSGAAVLETNARVARRLTKHVDANPHDVVVVLFGMAHICGAPTQLREMLEEAGVRTTVVLGFFCEMEEVLRDSTHEGLHGEWYDCGEAMLRAPCLTLEDVNGPASGEEPTAERNKGCGGPAPDGRQDAIQNARNR